MGEEFHLQALITVVDAPGGAGNLAAMPEARQQVALADRIVLTKTDRADPATVAALTAQIRELTAAPLATAAHGVIAPGFLLDEGLDLPVRARAQSTTTRTPIRTGSTASRCFSRRPCRGRCSSRRWRC